MGLKDTSFHFRQHRPQSGHKEFIQRHGQLGTCRSSKGGTASLLAVAEQGELGDDQGRPAHIQQGQIQLAALVFKNAEVDYLFGQPLGLFDRVILTHTQQDEKAPLDGPAHFSLDFDVCSGNFLDECSQ